LKRFSWKISQHGKGNSQSCLRGTKSPIQDKPKEKYTKTHIKETNKDWTQRKNIKTAREKQQVTYKGNPISLTADLSEETLWVRRKCQDIFKVMKGKNLQPRLLYPARISFKIDRQIKSFNGKQKQRNSGAPNKLYNKCQRDFYNLNIGAFDIVSEVSETILSFFFIVFFCTLLFSSYFHHSEVEFPPFHLTYPFFCLSYSAVDSFWSIFNFSNCVVGHCLFFLYFFCCCCC